MSPSTNPETILCHCLGVTETDVRIAISSGSVQSLKCLMNGTGAGTGCTACIRRLSALISEEGCPQSSPSVEPAACVAR
jgi:bacterioferritin-associated ferredoxin